ncbi:MAG: hypothetical protein R3178_02975 [Rhodothermales bacterium]|nr:hypothetical protein [Rhodothermales bacterium]
MAVVAVMALGLASTAYANYCSYDAVPAATLLFPFVIYDYENEDSGETTLFAITNVSSEAQIVHITVWTDFSVAILDFNLTLTGYDVQTMNIRDILRDGILPHEGNGANIWEDDNAGDSPFADGPFSPFNELWGGALDLWFNTQGLPDPEATAAPGPLAPLDCDPAVWDSSPNNYQAAGNIPSGTLALFETYLKRSQDADRGYYDCAIANTVDFDVDPWFITRDSGPVWLYVTADVVGACNKDLPDSNTTYYDETTGEGVIFNNVLIGDIIYLNPGQNYSEAINAVHLEAVQGFGGIDIPESLAAPFNEPVVKFSTFYARFHLGAGPTFQDWREPLPTAWAFRYLVAPDANAKTWIRAWKGGTLAFRTQDLTDSTGGVITGQNPDELYASSCWPYTYYAWDEDEGVNSVGPGFVPPWSGGPTADPIPVPNLLPLETQQVDAEEFFLVGDPATGAFGWMLFIFPRSNNYDGAAVGVDYDYYQTWMGVKYAAFGTYTAGLEGAVMGNYNCSRVDSLPGLGLNRYSE